MKSAPTEQKLRGGYYTPKPIADFLAAWAIRSGDDLVLEPSCGDGELAGAAVRRFQAFRKTSTHLGAITAIEIEKSEAQAARRRLADIDGQRIATVVRGDFFEHSRKWGLGAPLFAKYTPFDAVIGNPPFIRYQNFPEDCRNIAIDLMGRVGFTPNRLTNAWVPFLIVAAHLLKEDGRLAMVLPSELLQVSYAAETRQFLSHFFERVTIVTFRDLVFGSIQQDIVLLLGERRTRHEKGIAVVELNDVSELKGLAVDAAAHPVALDHSSEKWLQYFLDQKEIDLLRLVNSHHDVARLGVLADVDVGLVTGENSFFVLTGEATEQLKLWRSTAKLVSRSAHVQGLRFASSDWEDCLNRQQRVLLFCPPDADKARLSAADARYIKSGEDQGLNKGYKCRIRKRWWVVPSQWVPDAFGLRQVHAYPRIVLNHAGAHATDTLHRIRFKPGVSPARVASAFVNSLTLAASEVTGRGYGGGVLTFEPSEFEALPIPLVKEAGPNVEDLDRRIRTKDVYACLEVTDKVLLQDGLGLGRRDVLRLRRSWEKLRNRRIARKATSSLPRAV